MILICLMAFADTFGGLFQEVLPLSLILRSAIILYLLCHALGRSTKCPNVQILWFAFILFFFTRVLTDYYIILNHSVVTLEVSATLRFLYFPLLFSYLLAQIENKRLSRVEIRWCLLAYGWLVLLSLLLGQVTGLGGTIGGRGADVEAGKGFMIGANEVGLMLLLTAPFVGSAITGWTRNVIIGGIGQLLIYSLAGLHVFTKSSLIASLVAAYSVYRSYMSRGIGTKILLWIAIFAGMLFTLRFINNNVEIIYDFAEATFFSSLIDGNIFSFLFRGRDNYIGAIFPPLLNDQYNWLFFLFGAGEFFIREVSIAPLMLEQGQGTTFEMDFFDAFGAYGLVGCSLYALILGILLKQSGSLRLPREIAVALFCVAAHSFLAGHVLFSPQVTTLMVLILLYFRADNRTMGHGNAPSSAAQPAR